MATLREKCAQHWPAIKAIGLSGQMHGAVLLDAEGEAIRPAILWNDTRCAAECAELEAMAPGCTSITRTPNGASSMRRAPDSACTAALEAQ